MTRLARLLRIATLHQTRKAILEAARSATLRDFARRTATDRAALIEELRDPATARRMVRAIAHHPATRELASAAMLLLPGRYLRLGWVAAWAARRVLGRHR